MFNLQYEKNVNIKYKREKSKIILFNKPKIRYIGDLRDIPNKLKVNSKYNYIFTIIDHFSKFLNSYLIIKKDQKTFSKHLEQFFNFYGRPMEFGSDNGREFVNLSVKNLLEKNNIRLINGAPYQPHSQGVVERVHRTIRYSLVAKFIEDTNNFNLETILPLCVHHYNNTIRSITKFTPNEICDSSDNELCH